MDSYMSNSRPCFIVYKQGNQNVSPCCHHNNAEAALPLFGVYQFTTVQSYTLCERLIARDWTGSMFTPRLFVICWQTTSLRYRKEQQCKGKKYNGWKLLWVSLHLLTFPFSDEHQDSPESNSSAQDRFTKKSLIEMSRKDAWQIMTPASMKCMKWLIEWNHWCST